MPPSPRPDEPVREEAVPPMNHGDEGKPPKRRRAGSRKKRKAEAIYCVVSVRPMCFSRDLVIKALRDFDWRAFDVAYSVLFGSVASRGFGNDVDIAVEFAGGWDLNAYSTLVLELMDRLGVGIDDIDVVVIGDETPCYLVLSVFSNSMLLFARDDDAIRRMVKRAKLCHDFLITARRLGTLETAANAVRRLWR